MADLGGGANEGAAGVQDEGVAAVEDGEGRERVEAGVESLEAGAAIMEEVFCSVEQANAA